MHEYSIASELVAIILERLKGENVEKVKEVHLRKGELRVLSSEALCQAYEILTENTVLAGSLLVLEEIKTQIKCHCCGYSGEVEHREDLKYHFLVPLMECPDCKSPVEIIGGKELELVKLVVEDK